MAQGAAKGPTELGQDETGKFQVFFPHLVAGRLKHHESSRHTMIVHDITFEIFLTSHVDTFW